MLTPTISPTTGRLVEGGSVLFLPAQVQRTYQLQGNSRNEHTKWTDIDGTSLDSVKWVDDLAKQQQRKDTRFSSVEKRINTSMALDFLFTRTSWTLSWDVACLQQSHYHPPEGSPFQHHNSTSVHPNVRLWQQRNRRILWPATECHWSDTEERYSCCARRLKCKSGRGCLWKLAKHFWTLLHDNTNERGLRLQEFAIFNGLVLVNTFGHYKTSRRWTWHSPSGQHHSQIDYI